MPATPAIRPSASLADVSLSTNSENVVSVKHTIMIVAMISPAIIPMINETISLSIVFSI